MSKSLYDEAIADAQQLRKLAEESAKNRVVEAIMPQIRSLVNRRILGEQLDELGLETSEEVVDQVDALLENLHQSLTKHYCNNCGFNSDDIFWRCPQCHEWETIQFRWKV